MNFNVLGIGRFRDCCFIAHEGIEQENLGFPIQALTEFFDSSFLTLLNFEFQFVNSIDRDFSHELLIEISVGSKVGDYSGIVFSRELKLKTFDGFGVCFIDPTLILLNIGCLGLLLILALFEIFQFLLYLKLYIIDSGLEQTNQLSGGIRDAIILGQIFLSSVCDFQDARVGLLLGEQWRFLEVLLHVGEETDEHGLRA